MTAPALGGFLNTSMDETLTLSFVNLQKKIHDNVFKMTKVLEYMKKRKVLKNGPAFSHGLMYGKNQAGRYSRFGQLDVTPVDGLTRDRWDMKQYYVPISIDGFTERTNAGEAKLEDAITEKRMQSELTLAEYLEIDFFATTSNSEGFNSLPEIIKATGTVGNVNGTTTSWWRATIQANAAGWAASGRKNLTTLGNTIASLNPMGGPDIYISDQTSLELFLDSTTAQERYTGGAPSNVGTSGDPTFRNTPWIWSTQATANTIYALNDKAIEFVVDKNTDFITTEFVKPVNQDAKAGQLLVMACLATPNRRKLGLMTVGS